jgi:hypothetical protein
MEPHTKKSKRYSLCPSFVEVRENKGTNVWGPRPGDDALLHEVVLCVEGTKKKR